LIKAADMMIARRADTKARADFATWKMMAKLNGASSLPAEAQTFLVSYKEIRQKKSGEPYLILTLADRSGDVDARMFDNAAEVIDTFEREQFVRVKGLLQVFQNRAQLTIHKIQPVAEADLEFCAGDKPYPTEVFDFCRETSYSTGL